MDRRAFNKLLGGLAAASAVPARLSAAPSGRIRRIATEEAFTIPDHVAAMRALAAGDSREPDLDFWRGLSGRNSFGEKLLPRLLDVEQIRLAEMDRNGIDMQLLSLTSPGVQMLAPPDAVAMAAQANDVLRDIVGRHPTRFAGLATIAPQDVPASVKEMERARRSLGLNGFIINSHTNGEYLDDQKFWPLFEAAEALDGAIYLHPRAPSPAMAEPYRPHRLEAAIWGYQAETGLHALRMIMSGLFDRFPKLQIVLGHGGEGLPYWLTRIDRRHVARQAMVPTRLARLPSEYFKSNFTITTSGLFSPEVLKYCLTVLGPERVMFAIDYPYEEMDEAARFIEEMDIGEREQRLVLEENAMRLFHIAPA